MQAEDAARVVRYAQKLHCTGAITSISVCIKAKHTDTYMHIFIDLNQSICPCMCLYVYGIQANMHLIQLLCERRYMQIHAYTCRYIDVCITYTSCICDMDCVISCAHVVHMQAVCPSHTSIHMCVVCASDTYTYMHWHERMIHKSSCRLEGSRSSMSIDSYWRHQSVGLKVQRRSDAVIGPECSAASCPTRSSA